MNINKYKSFTLGLCSSTIIFYLIFRSTSIKESLGYFIHANHLIIGITLGISIIVNILVSPYRWKLILRALNLEISWKEAVLMKIGSDSISRVLPMKAGEITRVIYLKRVKRMAYDLSIFSVLVEYLLNLMILIIFFCIGAVILLFNSRKEFFILTSNHYYPLFFSLSRNDEINGSWSHKIKRMLYLAYTKFNREFKQIIRNKAILLYSFLMLGAQLLNFYLISISFNVKIPYYAILLYLPIVIIISCMPISIAGLGFREALVILFFAPYANRATLLSIGLLYSVIEFLIPSLIGALFLGIFLNKLIEKPNYETH